MPKISQLPAAASVGAADLFAIVQSSTTKKATGSLVLAYVQANIQITESQVTNLTTDLAAKLAIAQNLADLNNVGTARTNLGLGAAALLGTPITAPNGGTGVASPTTHTIPIPQGASAWNFLGPLTNGQLLIGSTGADPVPATLTAGPGITIANSAGGIIISGGGGGFGWTEVTGTSQAMAVNNGYIANNAGLVTLSLPASANIGDSMKIMGKGAGGWLIAQGAGQAVHLGSSVSTTGAGGSLASTNQYDVIEIVCITANTEFSIAHVIGNITVV